MSAPLTLRLFGPMLILVNGEPLPRMRSRKARWLIALLALRGGEPVVREWVAGRLWPDVDASLALANLRPLVSEMRRALGDQAARLRTPDRKTIQLDLEGADADVVEFDAAIRASDLQRATELYGGPLLEDCAEEWVTQERASRERACLSALRGRAVGELSAGRAGAAVAICRRAVEIAPREDGPRRDLMEALQRTGDTNAALQTYREFAQLLRSRFGGTPDPKTTDLYVRLRSEAGAKQAPERAERSVSVGNVPHELSPLVGREDEIAEIAGRVRRHRLTTLTGPGGIGKTRLALAVARGAVEEYPDGVWFVPLESIADPTQVVHQIVLAMGLKDDLGQAALDRVLGALRTKRMLLVLDNCEHLLDACAGFCERALASCGNLRVLATSRQPLGVVGERVWSAPALTAPVPAHLPAQTATRLRVAMGYEAVRLFVERAREARRDFALAPDNVDDVVDLCAQLEGIPLAIEIAAARTRSMSPADIAIRLREHPLLALQGGRQGGPPRHQTARATLDWSFSLLSPAEKRLLGRLSVFAGGWTCAAAELVGGGDGIAPEDVADLLHALVEKSLIGFANGRYTMLETVRVYTRESLEDPEITTARHRVWCLAFAQEALPHLATPDAAEWLRRLLAEERNLTAALHAAHDDPPSYLRLCIALAELWWRQNNLEESARYFEEALAHPDNLAPTPERAKALIALSQVAWTRRDFVSSRALIEESLRIRAAIGDRKEIGRCQLNLGTTLLYSGKFGEALECYRQSLENVTAAGDERGIAIALSCYGMQLYLTGDCTAGKRVYDDALGRARDLGDAYFLANALVVSADLDADLGRCGDAAAKLDEAAEIFEVFETRSGIASVVYGRGKVADRMGDFASARDFHAQALEMYRDLKDDLYVANCLGGLGSAAFGEGDLETAHRHHEEAVRIFRKHEHLPGLARALTDLATTFAARTFAGSALGAVEEALRIQTDLPERRGVVSSLALVAGIDWEFGSPSRGVRLMAAAETLRESLGWVWHPRQEWARRVLGEEARSKLGMEAFGALWSEGKMLTLNVAVEEALSSEATLAGAGEKGGFIDNVPDPR